MLPQFKNRFIVSAIATVVLAFAGQAALAQHADHAPTNQVAVTSKNIPKMPWEILDIPQIGAKLPVKKIHFDQETGMTVLVVKYQKGFTNTWHTHPTAHGMYVIEGTLKTHQGEYGPGSWVWFPEGGWMEHGATAKTDTTILFITPKKFDIKYPGDKDLWYPMSK